MCQLFLELTHVCTYNKHASRKMKTFKSSKGEFICIHVFLSNLSNDALELQKFSSKNNQLPTNSFRANLRIFKKFVFLVRMELTIHKKNFFC